MDVDARGGIGHMAVQSAIFGQLKDERPEADPLDDPPDLHPTGRPILSHGWTNPDGVNGIDYPVAAASGSSSSTSNWAASRR